MGCISYSQIVTNTASCLHIRTVCVRAEGQNGSEADKQLNTEID